MLIILKAVFNNVLVASCCTDHASFQTAQVPVQPGNLNV